MSEPETHERICKEIDGLNALSFNDLKARYRAISGDAPPKRIGRKLLILAIAYEMQRKAFGVRADRIARLNSRAAIDAAQKRAPAKPRKSLKPGGRLLREWRGRSYEVYVADDGCYLDGERFTSLSAVAFAITGVKRNGPAFFGLRSPRIAS